MTSRRLKDLPAEIRNMIYTNVFDNSLVIATENNSKLCRCRLDVPYQILQTSEEIREEAMPYRCHNLTVKLDNVSNSEILPSMPAYLREGAHRVIDEYPSNMWQCVVYGVNFPNAEVVEFYQSEMSDCTLVMNSKTQEQITKILNGTEDQALVEKAQKKTRRMADVDEDEPAYPLDDEDRTFKLEINYFFLLVGTNQNECTPDYRLVVDWDSSEIKRRYWRKCEHHEWNLIESGTQESIGKDWISQQCEGCE